MKAKEIVEDAIKNVRSDRRAIQVQITDLNKSMQGASDMSKHSTYGLTLSKYAETLQRSNEQLIKLGELLRKLEEKNMPEEGDLDNESLYAEIDKIKQEED